MSTVISHGYVVTQEKNYTVLVTRHGKPIVRYIFSRPLSGEELDNIAFLTLMR